MREACARLKTSRALSRHLEALTLHHLHLGFMTHERPLPRRRLYDYLRLTAPVAADVTLLTVADRLAARGSGPTATSEMIEAHLELAREVLPEAVAWHRDGPPRAPIAGDELAAAARDRARPRARPAAGGDRGGGVHRRRGRRADDAVALRGTIARS